MPGMISIHVPARGTTAADGREEITFEISIHVPARGTTAFMLNQCHDKGISIHVPARGTTGNAVILAFPPIDFNPRPREGDDTVCQYMKTITLTFQSTSPRGGRQTVCRVQRTVP